MTRLVMNMITTAVMKVNLIFSSDPYSPTHLLTYSPTHLLTYSLTHLLIVVIVVIVVNSSTEVVA